MSKCPNCNSDLVWKGSMIDGGLDCPQGCKPYEEPSYPNAPVMPEPIWNQPFEIKVSAGTMEEILKNMGNIDIQCDDGGVVTIHNAFEAVRDAGNGYTITNCLNCGVFAAVGNNALDKELTCFHCQNIGYIRKLKEGPKP